MSSAELALAQARLAARLHDPPEKALVLMRTREGHEGGTVRALLGELFPDGLPPTLGAAVHRADRWASAADRAAFPNVQGQGRYPAWQQVRFAEQPVLINPLTGQAHALPPLASDVDAAHAQALGTDHLRGLIHRDASDAVHWTRTALALWRFGAEIDGELRLLWPLLPADSRVPDHTIHDHLDLSAALAASFADPPPESVDLPAGPALLAVSLGPVQDLIAAARSTADLWAGSHLLSCLAWEAMRVVCEAIGPEAVLFPRLRGVPLVDRWLRDDMGLDARHFASADWTQGDHDGNPLFIAALPNRFTALVPAWRAPELAQRITQAVRAYACGAAHDALRRILQAVGEPDRADLHGHAQIDRQLAGFPEVHWVSVPWSLVQTDAQDHVQASDPRLKQALQPFFATAGTQAPGWLDSSAWKLLSGGLELEAGWLWHPNPGALYPALHELLDRALAAVKATRPFEPMHEAGWRCALTGEGEWITADATQLPRSYREQTGTLWARLAVVRPSWARRGEHLSALPMLKRLWPVLFAEQVSRAVAPAAAAGTSRQPGAGAQRFVVSTHTMALASALEAAIAGGQTLVAELPAEVLDCDPTALPRRLASALKHHPQAEWIRRIPDWLDVAADRDGDDAARARLAGALGLQPDRYYGMVLLDGDQMGAWLSASPGKARPLQDSYHPQIQHTLQQRFGHDPAFARYARELRAPNPAWHMAISEALSHFALRLVPAVVERQHLGRLIYAGGDDVLAMAATRDLLDMAAGLRAAYSGVPVEDVGGRAPDDATEGFQRQGNGWVLHRGRLLRLMGEQATASCGLVVAHHQAPLSAVLRALRQAEHQAKSAGGRNAWSLSVLKRSGGALHVTARWGTPLRLFREFVAFLAGPAVSRRAAYQVLDWLHDVPAKDAELCQSLLAYRMQRQVGGERAVQEQAAELAGRLTRTAFDAALRPQDAQPLPWLRDFMLAAEFMAREAREPLHSATPAPEMA